MLTAADAPAVQGFIVNRILMPMINEAFFALMEVRKKPDAVGVLYSWPARRVWQLQRPLARVPVSEPPLPHDTTAARPQCALTNPTPGAP